MCWGEKENRMKKLIAMSLVVASCAALAETTPGMISLFTPVQAPHSEYGVRGVRLSLIYGQCDDFKGLDIGILNRTSRDFTGLAIGGLNSVGGGTYGG